MSMLHFLLTGQRGPKKKKKQWGRMKLWYNNRPLVATALDTQGQIFSMAAFQIAQPSSFCYENATLCAVYG